jgi:hypothetical protein
MPSPAGNRQWVILSAASVEGRSLTVRLTSHPGASHASVLSTTQRCRHNPSLISLAPLTMRALIPRNASRPDQPRPRGVENKAGRSPGSALMQGGPKVLYTCTQSVYRLVVHLRRPRRVGAGTRYERGKGAARPDHPGDGGKGPGAPGEGPGRQDRADLRGRDGDRRQHRRRPAAEGAGERRAPRPKGV